MSAPPPAGPGIWPHVRAALIAAHVAAVTLMAFPAPEGGLDRAVWKDPTVQGELKAWTENLNAVGIGVTRPELEERLWRAAAAYSGVRGEVLRPFGPYYAYCGTGQSWRMFVAPHRHPTALHVDVSERGGWRPVYVERDPHHDWLGRLLDSYRFRSVIFRFGWPGYEGEFDDFAHWIASRAVRDFPDADRVRVRLWKAETPSPEEVRAGTRPAGEFVLSAELPLGVKP